MRNPIHVKLGIGVNRGFYSNDVQKSYTEIQENKIAYNTLKVLDEFDKGLGVNHIILHKEISELQPELKKDKYGYLSTLPSLLNEFHDGGLIEDYNPSYGCVKLTKLGREFLANNVIPAEK